MDGVAMRSPLGPMLADIFVGYCESKVPEEEWPDMYCRFVDDSFADPDNPQECDRRLKILNGFHPALKFTCEHETNGCLPFIDVLVRKDSENGVTTSVHRKPTFNGLYITWDSFCATKYKINFVRNLVERAHRICSDSTLDEELHNLKSIFEKNGYPADLLSKLVCRRPEKSEQQHGPKRCPMYLRLPWKGPWSSYHLLVPSHLQRAPLTTLWTSTVSSPHRAHSV